MSVKPKLLLHSCCAPCSSAVLERLAMEYEITVFYYNPNIEPEEEYRKRTLEQKRLINAYNEKGIPLFPISYLEGAYDNEHYHELVLGLEEEPERGKRCQVCFKLRLEATAKYAAENGFDFFTTTLSISPHKDAALLNRIGRQLADKYPVSYLEANFKKQGGYQRSIELSREYGLYRQNFCGCIYSRKKEL